MHELKTVVTMLAQIPGEGMRPSVPAGLVVEAGLTPELVTVLHPRTTRRSQLFLFELDLVHLVCDGASNMEGMLRRMRELGHSVSYDQLAGFLSEMARLGVLEKTLGIEPSRRVVALPWRDGPEPEIVIATWPLESRQAMSRALALFRDGEFKGALELLGALSEHPLAGPPARRVSELILQALGTPVVPQRAAPLPSGDGFDDEDADGFEAEATLVLSREELAAMMVERSRRSDRALLSASFALRRGLRVAFIASLALGLASLVPVPFTLRYPCELAADRTERVRAGFAARVVEIHVKEGEAIAAGALVARLDDNEVRTDVDRLRAELARAEADLSLLAKGSRAEVIAQAEARISGLARALGVAADRVEGLRRDVRAGNAAAGEMEAADAERARLVGELRAAKAELELVKAGARSEDVQKAEADIEALRAQLALAERILTGSTLVTARGGIVITDRPEERVGQFFGPGDPVLEVGALERMRVTVFVEEHDFDALAAGQKVRARVSAFPSRELVSSVVRIPPEVRVREGIRTIPVEATVDNADLSLRPGMTGYAELEINWRPLASILGRRAVRWLEVHLFA